jgi:hypothetical protein
MPNGQMTADLSGLTGAGFFPGANTTNFPAANDYTAQPTMGFPQLANNNYVSSRSTDSFPQSFPQRPSEEEERLRQQLDSYARLLDDWIQFTEEKWRTVSDSQLGWKPLRGRWSNWDDIFQDAYAAKTSDPMAQAAQVAGEATARRYDTAKDKGSAASAVACFMRDMVTLRRAIDMLQQQPIERGQTPDPQPAVGLGLSKRFGSRSSGSLLSGSGITPRNSLIRRPAQIFVDADSDK